MDEMTLSDLSIGLTNVPILLDLAGAEPTLAVPAAATAPEDEEEAGTMVWGDNMGYPWAVIGFSGEQHCQQMDWFRANSIGIPWFLPSNLRVSRHTSCIYWCEKLVFRV